MSCYLSLGRLLTLNRARPTLNERARLLCMRWMAHQPSIICREQEATAHARRDDEGPRIPGVLAPGDRLALAQESVPSQDRERQQATGHGSCCAGQQICSQRRCVVHRANARLLHALAPCHGVDGHDARRSRAIAGRRSPMQAGAWSALSWRMCPEEDTKVNTLQTRFRLETLNLRVNLRELWLLTTYLATTHLV
jgi:hypothetical protein